MITACYVVANEADLIAESLRSLKAYVDRFVVVDCVFNANPIDATHSTDATREITERVCYPVPLTYIESDRKMDQHEARNRYLDEVAIGDWVVNLDGDEVLYGDHFEVLEVLSWLQFAPQGPRALSIPILSAAVMNNGKAADVTPDDYATAPIIHSTGWAPRLFRNTATLRYRSILHPNGIVDNQGAWEGNHTLASKSLRDARLMLVNHHVRQSYRGYQDDAVWEIANEQVPA